MKMAWYFFKWVILKIFNSCAEIHNNFRYNIRYNSVETLFFWFIIVMCATLCDLIILASFAALTDTRPHGAWIFALAIAMFVHMICTGFSVMFEAFKQDRAELFETIKNGK